MSSAPPIAPLAGEPPVNVVISYWPRTMQIEVRGPFENHVLFLGLLDMARVVVIEHRAKNRRVVIPEGVVMPPPSGKG